MSVRKGIPLMEQINPIAFSRLIFGLLAQDGRLTINTVAEDAATIKLANGQAFTVTVTASRPKVAPVAVDDKPPKRGKVDG